MINRISRSYRFLAPMLALGVAACSGAPGDASSISAPSGPRLVITSASVGDAGDGSPNQGELELCKTGDAASFEVTDGTTTLSYDLADGECVVAWVDVRSGLDTARLTVTELPSATSTLTSVTTTTINNEGHLRFDTRYGKVFFDNLFNAAFVQMEYFGYLLRDPDDAGFAFWLGKLNQFGNFVDAQMVLAFISSPEYRSRFGAP